MSLVKPDSKVCIVLMRYKAQYDADGSYPVPVQYKGKTLFCRLDSGPVKCKDIVLIVQDTSSGNCYMRPNRQLKE